MHIDTADIVVVGAGPAGTTAARLLAESGLDVLVLEEHAEPGLPVHCTGIVGEEIFTAFEVPRSLILNPLSRFRVVSPLEGHFDIRSRAGTPSAAYVIDRAGLDRWLAKQAAEAGARYLCNARVRDVEPLPDGVRVRVDGDPTVPWVRARICILACGSMSNLPARSGIVPPQSYHRTVQATWSVPDLQDAEVFVGQSLAPGSFGYAVAVGDGAAKVGIISRGDPRHWYARILHQALGGRLEGALTRENYRRIPMGAARRSVAGRVLAVGDAAGQTKTTTGGGIYYAMLCARMLAHTLIEARNGADFRVSALAIYERRWRRCLGLEIQAGLWLRGLFEHVSDEDVSRLIALADTPAVHDLFGREWNFDFHRRMLLGLVRVPEVRSRILAAAADKIQARRLFDYIVSMVAPRARGGAPTSPARPSGTVGPLVASEAPP